MSRAVERLKDMWKADNVRRGCSAALNVIKTFSDGILITLAHAGLLRGGEEKKVTKMLVSSGHFLHI